MKKLILFFGKLLYYMFPIHLLNKIKNLSKILYTGYISNSFKKFGDNSIISPFSKLKGANYIEIGRNVTIHDNVVLTAWDNYQNEFFSPIIKIGDFTSIGGECHISAINKILIGKNVLFGRKISLIDNSHGGTNLEDLKLPPSKRKLVSVGSITIQDNVWVGDKCTILAGVFIGENSIVGSNSVITKNVPPNSVVVGIPGKVIKKIKNNV